MSDEIAIQARRLGKSYSLYASVRQRVTHLLFGLRPQTLRELWVLRDVDFSVKRGETVGIVGRNGSGKSTLLQLICGTLTPTEGSVETRGRIAALLELGAGFNPEFTGRENVYLNARICGLSREQVDKRFDQIAAFADIGDFIDRPVKTYSSGMYLRLAFAVVAHVDADILVIDEALAVGDAFFVQKCMRFLRKFRETGTLLFVSHDAAAVINLCERAVWLHEGKMKALGPAKTVCEAYHETFVRDAAPATKPVSAATMEEIPPGAAGFGEGGATITHVTLRDESGNRLVSITGGEQATVSVHFRAAARIERPIVGFFVKDRLGQTLFGDNTFASHPDPEPIEPGETCEAAFSFEMPILLPGQFTIAAAIADGTQTEHRVLHWIHDATMFASHATAHHRGIVGIPMHNVQIRATSFTKSATP